MRKYQHILTALGIFMLLSQPVFSQAPPKPRDTTVVGPQTFAMIMGISSYKYVRPLTYADKDAEMFRDYLKSPGGGKVSEDNIFCLLNEQALLANFYQKGFQWLKAKQLQKGDRLFIYLAGHGDAIDEDQFFYLAYDCNPAGDKNNYLVGGAIQLFNLKKKIANETAKGVEVFFIMDACRSNELPGGTEGQNFLNAAISEKRAGEIIMLATGAGQESLEDASIGNGHGLFTYYLIDGLNGNADSIDHDNKITLEEIQKYVDRNVPKIAQDRFKRKQDPFFCCNENSTKIVSIVDTAYLRRWQEMKKLQSKSGGGSGYTPRGRGLGDGPADTTLIEAYNLFNLAIKESRLTGNQSAEYYYNLMNAQYPGTSYTIDAQSTMAVEFINFAQSKINLYLDCKDASSIQKIRAQIDEGEKTDEINSSFNRMEKVAQQEFYEVGVMLEKAIAIIMPDDPDFAKSLMGKMYFFKARGYFGRNRRLVDISTAFSYAYTAYASDKSAAYIQNTLASLHLDNNKYDSAIFYAKKAIINAPRWRYPYVTLAFAYKTQNQRDSAIKYYRRSIDVDPANADAYVDLGHYYYALNQGDSAIAYYQKALSIEPANPWASNNIGWLNYSRQNFPDAIKFFKRSIDANPGNINAYNGLAKTFFENKEYDSARIYYTKAFDHYKDKSIVNVYIGNFYKDLKQFDSAKVYYRMAAMLDPKYEEAFNNLGTASYSLKEYDSARIYYHQALQANPYSAYALINLGIVFRDLKNSDSTYSYFQQAVKLEPGNPSILNSLGVIYGKDKVYDSAKSYFRRALDVQPDYKPASKNIIRIFKELNQLDSVTRFMKGSSFLDPNSPAFMNDMGLAFFEQKRFDSARVYFRAAVAKEPKNPQFYNNLGLALEGLKMLDSSKQFISIASMLDKDNPVYWSNLTGLFRKLQDFDSASFYFRKGLNKGNDSKVETLYKLAEFFSDMKLYDSSEYYYRKVIQIDPGYKSALSHIGSDFLETEAYDSARIYLQKAVQSNPKSKSANLDLGLAFHALSNWDSAIVYLEKAIQLEPKSKSYFMLACTYAQHKQHDKAIENLKLAYQKGYKNYDALLSDPDLDVLKGNKDFQALLDKYVPDWRNH
ncbi:MAG: tetratricopeptide repeat protein [Chitinophagaceae bacterium]|nr:tetratricopeptide repeat protein [Chitinophagaceae bacterium]